jgi:hypothetical protein
VGVAAVSVAGPAAEFVNDRHTGYLDALKETAAAMASDADLVAVLSITYKSLLPADQGGKS